MDEFNELFKGLGRIEGQQDRILEEIKGCRDVLESHECRITKLETLAEKQKAYKEGERSYIQNNPVKVAIGGATVGGVSLGSIVGVVIAILQHFGVI